jgi:hypothetical protein
MIDPSRLFDVAKKNADFMSINRARMQTAKLSLSFGKMAYSAKIRRRKLYCELITQ